METKDSNLYSAPESKLDLTPDQEGGVNAFKDRSTWAVVLFSFLTLGIYIIYWMYTRTETLNRIHPRNPVPKALYQGATIFWLLTLVLAFASEFLVGYNEAADSPIPVHFSLDPLVSSVLDVLSAIGILIWAFAMRNRLNELFQVDSDHPLWCGPILTFFLQSWYLSYKINQAKEALATDADEVPEDVEGIARPGSETS